MVFSGCACDRVRPRIAVDRNALRRAQRIKVVGIVGKAEHFEFGKFDTVATAGRGSGAVSCEVDGNGIAQPLEIKMIQCRPETTANNGVITEPVHDNKSV